MWKLRSSAWAAMVGLVTAVFTALVRFQVSTWKRAAVLLDDQ